jgi:hypothetical protein
MKIKVQVIVESDDGTGEIVQEIAQLERGQMRPEEVGLTLAEAKGLLESLQRTVVEQQIAEYSKQQSSCPLCGNYRLHKGAHGIVYRTVFGKLDLSSQRLFHCQCQPQPTRSFSPLAELLVQRTSPELLYLEAKFASLVSYGLSMKLFEEVLPIGAEINASTIRNHTLAVAERLESELGDEQVFFIDGCERDWEKLPRPEMPLTVGIDGGYVDSCEQKGKKDGRFEVIIGKSITSEGESKCFGLVNSYDTKPKRRVFEVLKSQGMQMNQQITFLSDGGDTVRELQLYLNPQAEHLLDWFHIAMRLTVMNQIAKGLGSEESESRVSALKQLESLKWYLWHGNVYKALQRIEDLETDLEGEVITGESSEKLRTALQEFQTYIENNQQWIPNYGELWRAGERISTAFVESAVDQVLSKRFVKKQQMSWSRRGTHLLLQVRTRVLNEELRDKFDEWYPGFDAKSEDQARAA